HSLVEFIGEIGGKGKEGFLGEADALLFPIDWPEPFGLVMIEAMACGAPGIAWAHGSVPEIIEDGAGFRVGEWEVAARGVGSLASFDRRGCREVFERRFTAARMAEDYVSVYERLLERAPAVEFSVADGHLTQGVFAVR